jgi:transposase
VTRGVEISDEAWGRIEPSMPVPSPAGGRRFRDHRQVIEGIVFRYRTGVPWRDLPERFGPWQTVWKRHHRFATDGTWDRLLAAVQAEADAAGEVDWNVSVDSTISRAHQHSATAKREVSAKPAQHTGGGVE